MFYLQDVFQVGKADLGPYGSPPLVFLLWCPHPHLPLSSLTNWPSSPCPETERAHRESAQSRGWTWTLRRPSVEDMEWEVCVGEGMREGGGSGWSWLIQTLHEWVCKAVGTEYSAGSTVHPGGEAPPWAQRNIFYRTGPKNQTVWR